MGPGVGTTNKSGDSEDRQKKSNKVRRLKEAKSRRMYKLNVGDKDGGQMEDDDQFLVWEIGRMVSSGNH